MEIKLFGKRMWIGIGAVCLLVLIDQLTKILAVKNLKGKPSVTVIPGILDLGYVENHGMAFGMLENGRWFFIVVTILVLLFLSWVYLRMPGEKRFRPIRWGLIFVIAGAIGNLIDRIENGYVVDFFYLQFIRFPLFNVADCYVTWTAVVLMVLMLFYYKEEDYKKLGL